MENIDKIGGYFIAAVVLAVMPFGIVIGGLAVQDMLDRMDSGSIFVSDSGVTALMNVLRDMIGLVAAAAVLISAVAILWIGWRVIKTLRAPRQAVTRDYAFNADKSLRTSST